MSGLDEFLKFRGFIEVMGLVDLHLLDRRYGSMCLHVMTR